MKKSSEIHIRDPFILPVKETGVYYLYGTTDLDPSNEAGKGFDYYKSTDLENWDGPFKAFAPPSDFWADRNFWAPEVHRFRDEYYMLASFKSQSACRGTQILKADTPEGPFVPLTETPVTPTDWECLDGTLYVDGNGTPWLVFCHEWLQVFDGAVCAMPLSEDLVQAVGVPILLFRASEAAWVWKTSTVVDVAGTQCEGFVTDGPFLYRLASGELILLWSSFGENGYAISIATSSNGEISGDWIQKEEPIYKKNGGHGMLFHTFEGALKLAIHSPNHDPLERPIFLSVIEAQGQLQGDEKYDE